MGERVRGVRVRGVRVGVRGEGYVRVKVKVFAAGGGFHA